MLTALCGGGLLLGALTRREEIYYVAILAGSPYALKAGYESLASRRLDVNILMILAAIGAVAVGRPADAAVLLFLFSLSNTLEARAMSRTRSAIEGLIKLRPKTAIRLGDRGEETVPVESLAPGDRVLVKPFQQIPSDGLVLAGTGAVDESSMTGEAVPVEKNVGSAVLSGTQNLDAALTIEITTAIHDSMLERIVAIVEESQTNKASGERISIWFGSRYTVFVLAAALSAFLIRWGLGEASQSAFYSALVLLVALSPCALVISTPAATLSALAAAARRGMLVRGGLFIEELGRIDTVALDKTGTLSQGRPSVVEVCALQPALAPVGGPPGVSGAIACWRPGSTPNEATREVLRWAAAVEAGSTHPIASAITRAASDLDLDVPAAEEAHTVSGRGQTARVAGVLVKIGQRKFFADEPLPAELIAHIQEMEERGLTAVTLRAGEAWAAIGLRDEPRPAAARLVAELRETGVGKVAMLTGDNLGTARSVAATVGIDEVHAGLSPLNKAEILDEWLGQGRRVLMVGDGVNDAPALTRAHVGVAMGGLGSDIALRSADVVLIQDRVERLPELIRLGQRANRVIRANIAISVGSIVVLAILSLGFQLPLPLAVVGHEGTTVLVILNGVRLLGAAQNG